MHAYVIYGFNKFDTVLSCLSSRNLKGQDLDVCMYGPHIYYIIIYIYMIINIMAPLCMHFCVLTEVDVESGVGLSIAVLAGNFVGAGVVRFGPNDLEREAPCVRARLLLHNFQAVGLEQRLVSARPDDARLRDRLDRALEHQLLAAALRRARLNHRLRQELGGRPGH